MEVNSGITVLGCLYYIKIDHGAQVSIRYCLNEVLSVVSAVHKCFLVL